MDQQTNFKRKIIIAVSLFLVISSLFLVIWNGVYLPKESYSSEKVIFSVEKGQGSKEISIKLEQQGLIKSGPLFRLYALHSGTAGKLQAGDYLLSPAMTIPEIVKKFVAGDIIKERITIVEGWNLRDIGRYFEERGMFQQNEFFTIAGYPMVDYSKESSLSQPKDFSQEFACPVGSPPGDSCGDFLRDKPKNLGLEGYIFPDTYEIVKGESLEALMRKILKNFDKKLTPEIRDETEKQGKTIFEIVTMASIIEKEVRSFDDRQIVSGILWKRIKSNMPLQVDATVTYIIGKTTTKVLIEETKIDSPYNTYKYVGLPQGPISNPGLESIRAAIYPRESEYWFYLSKPDGETVFSKTFKEHNRAKAEYLK